MKSVSYSIPIAMVFKKYHCAKCGTKLKNEKTHRVVTKDDRDYYQYHDLGTFPHRDYDVYEYRFACPKCGARVSFDEQRIIAGIQNKQGREILSPSEIKSNYKDARERTYKLELARRILLPIAIALIGFAIYCIFSWDGTTENMVSTAALFLLPAAVIAVGAVRKYKGNYRMRIRYTYSYEKEAQLKKLHAYSSHNRDFITTANKCYCFYCKAIVDRYKRNDYTDDGQTALCPKCGMGALLPDSIEESLDEQLVSEMNEYWF